MMLAGEFKPLIEYEKLGKNALLSIPTPEHYLPLLYVVATGSRVSRSSFRSKASMGIDIDAGSSVGNTKVAAP